MLEACAPGCDIRETTHHYCIRYGGRTYPAFPKGEHGRGRRAEIEIGHIRKMIRHLHIDKDCAKNELPEAY